MRWYASASYLDFPRINFAGKFRADVSTINNCPCNFNEPPNLRISWNRNGTGEFYFFEAKITSAVYENGTLTESDPIVNSYIVNNLQRTPPRLVDLDPYNQYKSTIYGMNLSIVSDPEAVPPIPILHGEWVRSIIVYDMWVRLLCSRGDPSFSAQATSKLKNVTWGQLPGSVVLEQLQKASDSEMGSLSVRITHYYYTSSDTLGNYTFGNVIGSIGFSRPDEPLNAAGQRLLSYQDVPIVNITVSETDSCNPKVSNNESFIWAYKAPFKVRELANESSTILPMENSNSITTMELQANSSAVLSVDLSNSLAMDPFGNLRNLGTVQFATYIENRCCMEFIGPRIDYLKSGWLQRTSGIVDINLQNEHLERLKGNPLLLVRVTNATRGEIYEVCGKKELVQVLLKEIQLFIRPMDYIVSRLQRTYTESASFDLLVTDFGVPAVNVSVNLTLAGEPFPKTGVIPTNSVRKTNTNGIATFSLQVNDAQEGRIPYPRQTGDDSCPGNITDVDGQIYEYLYNIIGAEVGCSDQTFRLDSGQFVFCTNLVSILAHSDPDEFNYTEPYTWVDHVQPIFEQYYLLYPVMSNILNMSDYNSVTLPHNIDLLRFAMSRNFDDPTYMPVTRDLSPLKQHVILKWLSNPRYNADGSLPNKTEPTCNPTRNVTFIPEDPECDAIHRPYSAQPIGPMYEYFNQILVTSTSSDGGSIQNPDPPQQCQWQMDAMNSNCTLDTLKDHVQQAIQLEFATIPLYMTTLYSIVDGCNTEVYSLIRSIIMQEMLHMAQAANILIALGGNPDIDSNETAPNYPSIGLPGCVLPNLNVTLKRASRRHIYDVFMGVEFPHETEVARNTPEFMNSTIGQFYMQVNNCISELSDNGVNIFTESSASRQVQWPWPNTYGTLHIVRDVTTAMDAIREITEQGEGTSPTDPDVTGDELAHFYKYEEIVCRRALIRVNDTHYSYGGEEIPFDQQGVWPMRDNPSKSGITRGTRAYFETKAFHQVYRTLLRKLQEVFNGEPEKISDAVAIMESLQVHAKRLMALPLDPNDPNSETVGPVFDYFWED